MIKIQLHESGETVVNGKTLSDSDSMAVGRMYRMGRDYYLPVGALLKILEEAGR